MVEFVYNNAKNTSTGHTPFEPNGGYHFRVFYEKDIDPCSKSKSVEKLSSELWELMTVYQQNLYYKQELRKQVYDKYVKPRSYVPRDKIWLTSKHLKTKPNCKLEAKFLGLFWVLHPIRKQTYKLKLPKKWEIYEIFHIFLLEQDRIKKR